MNVKPHYIVLGLLTWVVGSPPYCIAEEEPPRTKSLQFENDDLPGATGRDRWYTQAFRITETYRTTGRFAGAKPSVFTDWWCTEGSCTSRGWSFGQSMFSPGNITAPPNPRDRPWGGWLYIGRNAQKLSEDENSVQQLEVAFGVIGPLSGAKWVQREWHKLVDAPEPQWNNNLRDEPGFYVDYQQQHRVQLGEVPTHRLDVVPYFGGNLGNVTTSAYVGGSIRAGCGIRGFGTHILRPSRSASDVKTMNDNKVLAAQTPGSCPQWLPTAAYAFVFGEVRAVVYNIFIDGNLLRSGPGVDREPVVVDAGVGLDVRLGAGWRMTYTLTKRSREFKGPPNIVRDPQVFASALLSHDFP